MKEVEILGITFDVDIAHHQPEEQATRDLPFVPESYEIHDLYHANEPFLDFIEKIIVLGRLHPTKSGGEIISEKL